MVVKSRAAGHTAGPLKKLIDEECMLSTPWVKGVELETGKLGTIYAFLSH